MCVLILLYGDSQCKLSIQRWIKDFWTYFNLDQDIFFGDVVGFVNSMDLSYLSSDEFSSFLWSQL